MGASNSGILVYGHDLGEDWGFDWEAPKPDWYVEDLGWQESAENALLAALGFTETDWQADGYYERKHEAQKKLAVEFVRYSYECSWVFLAAVKFSAYQGGPEQVDVTVPEGADEVLAWAVETLGLTVEGGPRWLLGSEW